MQGLVAAAAAAILATGCSDTTAKPTGETIRIGVSLPYSGKESALGRNLEQALILAVDDVNRAGGIDGVPLELVARDSHSGTDRGFEDLLDLLYNEQVSYLIGPEETELSIKIVSDVRGLDVLNILPGFAAPSSERSSTQGAWMRLAPTPFAIACGLGAHARAEGAQTANVVYSLEDYNTSLATDFRYSFNRVGGDMKASVNIQSNLQSYGTVFNQLTASPADQTLLIAYPGAAASMVTEWMVEGHRGHWYLSPLLRSDTFLLNIPYGALDGSFGLSPTLSLPSECDIPSLDAPPSSMTGDWANGYLYGSISCSHQNQDQFDAHFRERWEQTRPFSAANFYYDAVVLLAMGMHYAKAVQGSIPSSGKLHQLIRSLNARSNEPGYWYDLPSAMKRLSQGDRLRYVGAATEYDFNQFGIAQHQTFDAWTIERNEFAPKGVYFAACFEGSKAGS